MLELFVPLLLGLMLFFPSPYGRHFSPYPVSCCPQFSLHSLFFISIGTSEGEGPGENTKSSHLHPHGCCSSEFLSVKAGSKGPNRKLLRIPKFQHFPGRSRTGISSWRYVQESTSKTPQNRSSHLSCFQSLMWIKTNCVLSKIFSFLPSPPPRRWFLPCPALVQNILWENYQGNQLSQTSQRIRKEQ